MADLSETAKLVLTVLCEAAEGSSLTALTLIIVTWMIVRSHREVTA